jgi:mevalonate kinase
MDTTVYYSHGKLLITGEYLILDGAKGLALPTKFGQSLEVSSKGENTIHWTGYDADGSIWYEDEFTFETIKNKTSGVGDSETRKTLIELLHFCSLENRDFLDHETGYSIITRLTFPRKWGLGTSSTLVNNLGQWLHLNPYALLAKTFGGSGYDIACAQHAHPMVFRLENEQPIVEPVRFQPKFKNSLYFVYLNQKQSSRSAIQSYMKRRGSIDKLIPKINQLTQELLDAENLKVFSALLLKHEALMSAVLEMKTVQEALFPDFNGVLKSLGAWGGDFILCASKEPPHDYFKFKGYETVLSFEEMI